MNNTRLTCLWIVLTWFAPVAAQEAVPAPIKFLPTQTAALALAKADLLGMPESEWKYMRYVWIDGGVHENWQANSLTVNEVSRANVILRPPPLGRETLMLARCDLRLYAPKEKDIKDWLTTWEDFQFDPKFSLFITAGNLKFFQEALPDWSGKAFVVGWVQKDGPYVGDDGQKYTGKHWSKTSGVREIVLADLKDIELARLPGSFDHGLYWELVEMTGSLAPVVSSPYFAARAMTTIQDKGIYATIYGGRYYQLVGIEKSTIKGATDEDVLFEKLGIGNVAQGVTAKKIFAELRSDRRAGMFRSNVTSAPRQVEVVPCLAGSVEGSRLLRITHDLKRSNIDIDVHPVANLLNFTDDGREIIFPMANGLDAFVIASGKGKILDEVPFDVAKDYTEPQPQHGRLQGSVSCKSCHSAEGSDGYKAVRNDVKRLLDFRLGKLDIIGDLKGSKSLYDPDTIARLAGLYQGDFDRLFMRGRDDYAAAVLRATGPWKASKTQTDIVKYAASHQVKVVRDYFYGMVDAKQALYEYGVDCDPKMLPLLLEPPPGAIVDPRIGGLMAGIPITRFDFDLSYSPTADHVRKTAAALIQKGGTP